MRILFIQHVSFENPGAILNWAEQQGHSYSTTRLFAGEEPPPLSSWDLMVIMGGPMSVHDESEHPWLLAEKKYISEAIQLQKYMIGVCLGAQLIADVMGAKVYPNVHKEIGWFPIQWTQDALQMLPFKAFPREQTVFHWHGETFDLPEGAALLASSEACRNQAFAVGQNIFGFQFHSEMLQENIRLISENCGDEIQEAPYIQSADKMLRASALIEQSTSLLKSFLDQIGKES